MAARERQKTRLAQYLRANATAQEEIAWQFLRMLREPRFRRQATVGPYVLDFYAPRWGIAVEIDGPFHDKESDRARDAWLGDRGIHVLRYAYDNVDFERMVLDVESLARG